MANLEGARSGWVGILRVLHAYPATHHCAFCDAEAAAGHQGASALAEGVLGALDDHRALDGHVTGGSHPEDRLARL
eukprot:scaffold323220_cov29-Prasinocladus_malaysianus.AAC.1